MVEVKQNIPAPKLEDYKESVRKELRKIRLADKIVPGSDIAITAGSRGISHISGVIATVVAEVKKLGGHPFIIPAMGSHGGATPEGQVEVLKSLGVTPETVDAPIHSSMEVDVIGRLVNGALVYMDRNALKADGLIIVNRVKPHTDFKGKIESGLMKMMAIGLGKQKGAEMYHWYKTEGYHEMVPTAARVVLEKLPILLGLAIVENSRHEIAEVNAIEPESIEEEEMKLLEKSKNLLARIPFKDIDVLIVEEFGKNISGVGMDTNVTGRFWLPGEQDPRASKIKRIVVLDLTEETHGNAIGIGLADVITKRLSSKIDPDKTYVNCLTQASVETGKIPIVLPNDRDAISIAIRTSGPIEPEKAKVVRIKNTLELEKLSISENLLETLEENPELTESIEVLGEPREFQFDVLGTLAR
jgi:hypothetical protein